MLIEIVCTAREMEEIIKDLSRRRAELCGTETRGSDLVGIFQRKIYITGYQ